MSRIEEKPLTEEERGLLIRLIERGIRELKPTPRAGGIQYEGVEDLYERYGVEKLHSLLEALADKGFLLVKEYDRVILCPKCGSVNIHSKYTCPRCHSMRVDRMELIEHPFCGYIGDKGSFITDFELICPNCKTELGPAEGKPPGDGSRQDYRIIGSSFECRKCGYRFERPQVVHTCDPCGALFNYRTARYETLYSYEIPGQVAEALGLVPELMSILQSIESALEEHGYIIERNGRLIGVSGGEHTFNLVAKKSGRRIVVDISRKGEQRDMVSLLGKKMDVRPTSTVLIDMSGSNEISALGKVYEIAVFDGKDLELKRRFSDHLHTIENSRGDRVKSGEEKEEERDGD